MLMKRATIFSYVLIVAIGTFNIFLGPKGHVSRLSSATYAQAIASVFANHHDVTDVVWSSDGRAALFFCKQNTYYILKEVGNAGDFSASKVDESRLERYVGFDSRGIVEVITDSDSGQSFEIRPEPPLPPSLLPPDTRA